MSNYRWLTFYLLILFALAACRPSGVPVPVTRLLATPPTTPESNLVEVTRVVTDQLEPTATPTQTTIPSNLTAAVLPTLSTTPTATFTPTPQPTSDVVAGWLTYHNSFFSYDISYPPETNISVRGFSGFPTEELPPGMTIEAYYQQLEAIYPDDICVSLGYSGGFVTILPPAEAGGKYGHPCGVTGVGDYDIVDVSETVTIDSATYTAEGWQVRLRDEAATWHNEFYFIWLTDGTLIQFGRTSGTEEQFLAIKDTLLQIVESYRAID